MTKSKSKFSGNQLGSYSPKYSYGKYLSQNHSNRYGNSSFWMDDLVDSRTDKEEKFDILKMAQYQRAIANFVKIVARKDIPVKFHSKESSYTDSETVVLSASVTDKSFDITAGLALHEASHILMTQFDYSKEFFRNTNRSSNSLGYLHDGASLTMAEFMRTSMPYAASKNFKDLQVNTGTLFTMTNWIEDRRIDSEIFRIAPGYKTYYHSLYEKYFLNKDITKALKSREYRTEDVKSYLFRIEALLNPVSDPKALRGLQRIINLLDLHNISRLKTTQDSIGLAMQIMDLVCYYVDQNGQPNPNPQNQQGDDKSQPSDDGNDEQSNYGPSDDTDTNIGDDENDEMGGADMPDWSDLPELSRAELSKVEKAITEMESLIQGQVKKKKATKDVSSIVDTIAGGTEFNVDTVAYNGSNVPVLKVYMSDRILRDTSSCDMLSDIVVSEAISNYFNVGKHFTVETTGRWGSSYLNAGRKAALDGLNLGIQLGRKLQVRDQVKDTKYTRLKSGKIDNRILYQAGYDAMNIFHHINFDKYIPSVIDISIDASSSMSGEKWYNTQTAVLAIAKACSMIQNVRVKVSYRYEANISTSYGRTSDKLVLVDAYDSKRDKITHLTNLVFAMKPNNCTPDSLITKYQLNKKLITPGGPELKSYFINFSDGGPGSSVGGVNYHGTSAHAHIKKCRKEIESMNVKVMSYYISEGDPKNETSTLRQFKDDWGVQNAKQINVTDILALAKTMNDMFLSK